MEIRLKKLRLKNFKGCEKFTLEPNGQDIEVFGDNETGKTTLFDAFLWVLFGKDSENKSQFEIKTLDEQGNVKQHGLDHEVEIVLEVGEKDLTLQKTYRENWVKKRGSADREFSGHTTEYVINGIAVKKKEYDEEINSLGDEEAFRLLTDPKYFNEVLDWKKRRALVIEVCGDVTMEEVIDKHPDLKKLPEFLGDHKFDKYQEHLASQKSKINQQRKEIETRIDETKHNLPEELKEYPPKEEIDAISREIDELKSKRAKALYTGVDDNLEHELAQVKQQIAGLIEKAREGVAEKAQEQRKIRGEVKDKIEGLERTIENRKYKIDNAKTRLTELDGRLDNLKNEWVEIKSEEFEEEGNEEDNTCPTCGQILPYEQINEARETALNQFNQKKAEQLESNEARGKELAQEKEYLEQQIEKEGKALKEDEAKLEPLKNNLDKVEETISKLDQERFEVIDTAEIKKLEQKKKEIESQLQAEGKQVDTTEYDEKISSLQGKRDKLQVAYDTQQQIEKGNQRIKELMAQEKDLAKQYDELSQQTYLMEEFTRKKVAMLETKINEHFKYARFKMFHPQINEGLREMCETTYKGVPYPSLNNAGRFLVGLDIIMTISEYYDMVAPIFLDNAEAVTKWSKTQAQQVRLYVSSDHKKLTVAEPGEIKVKQKPKGKLF